jgi:hypothetical protein
MLNPCEGMRRRREVNLWLTYRCQGKSVEFLKSCQAVSLALHCYRCPAPPRGEDGGRGRRKENDVSCCACGQRIYYCSGGCRVDSALLILVEDQACSFVDCYCHQRELYALLCERERDRGEGAVSIMCTFIIAKGSTCWYWGHTVTFATN